MNQAFIYVSAFQDQHPTHMLIIFIPYQRPEHVFAFKRIRDSTTEAKEAATVQAPRLASGSHFGRKLSEPSSISKNRKRRQLLFASGSDERGNKSTLRGFPELS